MKIKYQYEFTIALLVVTLIGLFYSRFMISCGTVGLCLVWLLSENKQTLWVNLLKNKLALSAIFILIIYLVSFINSENYANYWAELKNKVPYFFIPLSIIGLRPISGSGKKIVHYLFLTLLLASSAWSFYYYTTHAAVITHAYSQGQIIPTVIHHVSYTFLLVIGVLLCAGHFFHKYNKWSFALHFIIIAWLIFMIHLLATRTGIVCLYVSLPVYISCICIKRKAYAALAIAFVTLGICGTLLFATTDTLRQKVSYVIYDLKQINQNINTDNQLSDSRRLLSNRLGWEIASLHPWLGVGMGDIKDEMNRLYDLRYPLFDRSTRGYIHNQFICVLAGGGFVLGLCFLVCICYPLYYYFRHHSFLLGAVYLGLLLVLIWEPFLEYQLGNSIYLLILVWGINQKAER